MRYPVGTTTVAEQLSFGQQQACPIKVLFNWILTLQYFPYKICAQVVQLYLGLLHLGEAPFNCLISYLA